MPTELVIAGIVLAAAGVALLLLALAAHSKTRRVILVAAGVVTLLPGAYILLGLLAGCLGGEFG